ncbi:MAG TPA: DUF2283 domain-containing protein [Rhizomicrobium sp.]|nr:DUF2283 domain-containing protein [Rhizomicrobium sp.]
MRSTSVSKRRRSWNPRKSAPGAVLDHDARGRVVGIEMLNVRVRLPEANLKQVQVELARKI